MTTSADRFERQSGYVLHSRPYRETSALVDYFSQQQGLIRAVVKGVRGSRSKQRILTQPFQLMELNWRGRAELKTLLSGEPMGAVSLLQGRALWCGLYLNELTLRLIPQADPLPKLFAYYQLALERLNDPQQQEPVLRIYERQLLQQLGLGIDFDYCLSGQPIQAESAYHLDPHQGFIRSPQIEPGSYRGHELLAIARDDFQNEEIRRSAKRLMRSLLAVHLGDRPLRSRELFQASPVAPHPSQEALS
ncbi:DNA repair protein RecO [Motiliproteus sp.]|uniref:DNA repair protein RecO n=1 Tax=Motiliproteus sp. TaxID=1898955 RepID=UPI003BA8FF8F